jgi:hypothetical protein
MPIYLHGGKCCGIKHIFGLGHGPDSYADEKGESPAPPDEARGFYNSPYDFYTPAAPYEKTIDRLDRYLAYIKEKRPEGVVEVVISDYQFLHWREPLLERGFRLVTTFRNSNSKNKCEIYHLVTGE